MGRRLRSALCGLGLAAVCASAAPAESAPAIRRIVLVGDSAVADKDGWGRPELAPDFR
jgi:hypothetical protein